MKQFEDMNSQNQIKEQVIQKIHDYRIPDRGREAVAKARILLIVGVSGAGKNAIIRELTKTGRYHYIVSHTTRAPRMNQGVMEQSGVNYHFVSWEAAGKLLDEKQFIEAKHVYGLNMYGTSIQEIETATRNNQWAVTDIDVEGVEEYKKLKPETVAVFVLPPSYEEWKHRLLQRYTDHGRHETELTERKKTALNELERAISDGYFEFVINRDVKEAAGEVEDIVADRHEKKQEQEAEALANELRQKIQSELDRS